METKRCADLKRGHRDTNEAERGVLQENVTKPLVQSQNPESVQIRGYLKKTTLMQDIFNNSYI